jgi:hypothetical protein
MAISCVEMLIGASTVTGLLASAAMAAQKKPANVFLFVLVSAAASFIIGAGLFRRKEWARMPLVFFSGYIILTKMLVFTGLMKFSGEIITFIPADLKNLISILYHFFVVVYFTRMSIKKEFT